MKRYLSVIMSILAISVVLGSGKMYAAQAAVFNPETFTLANGMQVVVISNHRAPIVTHMVWYKVGSADEPNGKTGVAHFLEHLMFKLLIIVGAVTVTILWMILMVMVFGLILNIFQLVNSININIQLVIGLHKSH